jgi:hypothetical protein
MAKRLKLRQTGPHLTDRAPLYSNKINARNLHLIENRTLEKFVSILRQTELLEAPIAP